MPNSPEDDIGVLTEDPLVEFDYNSGPAPADVETTITDPPAHFPDDPPGTSVDADTVKGEPRISGDCCYPHRYRWCENGGTSCVGGTNHLGPCETSRDCPSGDFLQGDLKRCVGGAYDGFICESANPPGVPYCEPHCLSGEDAGYSCAFYVCSDGWRACGGGGWCSYEGYCSGGCPLAQSDSMTLLNPIEFVVTVTIPFDEAGLGGLDPASVDLVSLGWGITPRSWSLAVSANGTSSPGHEGPVGDRFVEFGTTNPTLDDLSDDLGDYGVFWNTETRQGFAWANVDYAAYFSVDKTPVAIPAVTTWGLVVMALLVLTAGTVATRRRQEKLA